MDICKLEDLPFTGNPYTWTNNRTGDENVQEHLDRFFVIEMRREKYGGSFVSHLDKRMSNHLSFLLCMKAQPYSQKERRKERWSDLKKHGSMKSLARKLLLRRGKEEKM